MKLFFFWIPGKRGATASVKLRDLQRIQTFFFFFFRKEKGRCVSAGFYYDIM